MKSTTNATPWTRFAPSSSGLTLQSFLQTLGKWYVPALRRPTSIVH